MESNINRILAEGAGLVLPCSLKKDSKENEMDFIGINGSPRKNMNSAHLLKSALAGIEAVGGKTKTYHLYDLNYKGCRSCFLCKKINGKSYGRCAVKDDLKNVLADIDAAAGFVAASPIYFGDATGQMRSFLERLLFQKMIYSNPTRSVLERRKKIGLIYTMNVDEDVFAGSSIKAHLERAENSLNRLIGDTKTIFAFGTNQLNKYDNIEYTYFDVEERLRSHRVKFPLELAKAKAFGKSLL